MVMRNRHDGGNSPGWWDDLPPAVKKRLSRPQPAPPPATETHPKEPEPAYRPAIVSDLSRLAILFVMVALANVLFLLLALAFLSGRSPLGP